MREKHEKKSERQLQNKNEREEGLRERRIWIIKAEGETKTEEIYIGGQIDKEEKEKRERGGGGV